MDESDKQKSLGPGASLGHSTFTASWAIQHLQENRAGSDSHLHFLSHQSMEKQKVRVEEAEEEEEEEEVQVRRRSSSSQQQRNWLFPSPACWENTSAGVLLATYGVEEERTGSSSSTSEDGREYPSFTSLGRYISTQNTGLLPKLLRV